MLCENLRPSSQRLAERALVLSLGSFQLQPMSLLVRGGYCACDHGVASTVAICQPFDLILIAGRHLGVSWSRELVSAVGVEHC